jgi:hypothetical protein
MQRKDYFERLIEQVVAAIAHVLGLARESRFEEAERELDAAWSSAVGFRRKDAMKVDGATLKMLLGAKAELAAKLLEAEAELESARGVKGAAEALRRRALELRG